jgi:polysaccharide biosynthesis/export protein
MAKSPDPSSLPTEVPRIQEFQSSNREMSAMPDYTSRTGILTGWTGRVAAAVIVAVALSGCATKLPMAPAQAESNADYAYLIGPGDNLNIVIWRNPELSTVVPVRPDGMITTPLVEDIKATNKTPTQLAREVEKALTKYIQDPIVTIIVTGFVGPYSEQVRIVGQATRPQTIPYRQNMSVLDVMIAVGGLTDFAAGNRATILRTREGSNAQYRVRLNDLLQKGDVSANVEMRPGDVLIIPESYF